MIVRYNPTIHKELAMQMGRAIHKESRFRAYNYSEAKILKHGCVEVCLSSSAEISTNSALRLYNKLGYKEIGFITRKGF